MGIKSVDAMGIDRQRFDSDTSNGSDFAGLENLEPLELEDIPSFSTRFMSNDCELIDELEYDEVAGAKFFTVAMNLKRKRSGLALKITNNEANSRARRNWKKALILIKNRTDPWEKFNLDVLPVEKATRHRYNAIIQTWTTDLVLVKMDKEPFDHGAMRECFRMKKLSNFCSDGQDWKSDCNNYVAKRYMDEEVKSKTYYDDVKLQMDAKLWGEEYNRQNPPKKVDIFQMALLEFHEREGSPLFHIEHFIEGDYVKYNSNSGFVDNKYARQTPHAFSHFTFEKSGHEIIVVDVQGVGDLYTDPQIHTFDNEEYGDGNLGTKGMALFFHSHSCNSICKRLNLTQFDLATKELDTLGSEINSRSATVVRGIELLCESPSCDLPSFFRPRSGSQKSDQRAIAIPPRRRYTSEYVSNEESSPPTPESILEYNEAEDCDFVSFELPDFSIDMKNSRRKRYFSECSEDSGIRTKELDKIFVHNAKPSCIVNGIESEGNLILGQVHLDLALYHEVCRFVKDETVSEYDKPTALFHLRAAADCGVLPAIISYARLHLGLPHDILTDTWSEIKDEKEKNQIGFLYMQKAALFGDRSAQLLIAHAYDYGQFDCDVNKVAAVHWYEHIEEQDSNDEETIDWGVDDPPYMILARLAEIWREGFENNKADPNKSGELFTSAAESAMTCMKGKLANKYYMLAEEAWGEVEEAE
ncbi:eukaryotic elongation factor 2 kinase isoform X2 [Lepeophtheirus salmonis]|uniref:eukaryotic elongation factor 2 kinase isoform X2 n=1 Tax=Lepeophtheirus salmonis TaxID=72036 RepID=UPI001AE27413|nr:eukaryotic elongation factor 2 kinase-like isoform X2 [Lepeophtheirus salmonis]